MLWRELVAACREVIELVHVNVDLFVIPGTLGKPLRRAYAVGAPTAFSVADSTGVLIRIARIGDAVAPALVVFTTACTCVNGVRVGEPRDSQID